MIKNERSVRIDILKGISIIAVVMYHIGILPFGYLGVDVFLVIGGYMMMVGIDKSLDNNTFSYWKYIYKRLVRLWPILIIVSIVSIGVGCFLMLPDDYENLSQSVIASGVFANNILACITTKNYWDIVNTYKPLMHTWYLGILMQAYVVIPLLILIVSKIFNNSKKALKAFMIFITIASFILFLLPIASTAQKFYYLPYRIFEISFGAVVALLHYKKENKVNNKIMTLLEIACFVLVGSLIFVKVTFIPSSIKLSIVVLCTGVMLYVFQYKKEKVNILGKCLGAIGQCSFSIYLWHQVVVAFMYYSVLPELTFLSFCVFIVIVAIISVLSYFLLEKSFGRIVKNKKGEIITLLSCTCVFIGLSAFSGYIYINAGVVRDVPELNISTSNIHKGMHAEYCDIPYKWDNDFENNDKIKVVVIGNSFGRDWANILSESSMHNDMQISYIFPYSEEYIEERVNRIEQADMVFYALGPDYNDVSQNILDIVSYDKLFIVGNKNFGKSSGIIYSRRKSDNYFNLTVSLDEELLNSNIKMKQKYKDHYIDLIEVVKQDDKNVIVFTNSGKFISQDCRHLTQSGAEFYAESIDFSALLQHVN